MLSGKKKKIIQMLTWNMTFNLLIRTEISLKEAENENHIIAIGTYLYYIYMIKITNIT